MSNSESSTQKILILGSGYGGLRTALDLHDRLKHRPDIQIILVDKKPHQLFQSSLYEVAAAQAPRETICVPIRVAIGKRSIRFLQDIVTTINPIKQTISLHHHGDIRYDYLVLALGCVPNDYGIPGLHDNAIHFGAFDDALVLRRAVQHVLRRKKNAHIVIGGGGPTGCELAGAFRYFSHDFCRHIGTSEEQHLFVDLVEQSGHLLSGLPAEVAQLTESRLTQLGVQIYCNTGIKKVSVKGTTLTNDNVIPYDILVWTGGVKANPLIQQADLPLDKRGRVIVNKYLQVKGFSRAYAIGDIASFSLDSKRAVPQVAPHAIWEAERVARNIVLQIEGSHPKPYIPKNFPTLIPLGGDYAILRWNRWIFAGKWVLLAKKYIELDYFSSILPFFKAWKMAMTGKHHRSVTGEFSKPGMSIIETT